MSDRSVVPLLEPAVSVAKFFLLAANIAGLLLGLMMFVLGVGVAALSIGVLHSSSTDRDMMFLALMISAIILIVSIFFICSRAERVVDLSGWRRSRKVFIIE